MEKEFVPYEQALDLKELGFDEPCFTHYTSHGYYNSEKKLKWKRPTFTLCNGVKITNDSLTWQNAEDVILKQVTCPTFSQAFRWFREKYGLIGFISFNKKSTFRVETLPHSNIKLNSYKEKYFDNNGKMWDTYEEAELGCLKKLIEIVKNGNCF